MLPPAPNKPVQQPLKRSDPLSASAGSSASMPMPPSRIPVAFHVRDEAGRLVFPSQRPEGDAECALLGDTLNAMLDAHGV